MADYDSGLQIIDISAPSTPSFVGTYNTSGLACNLYVLGNYAYVADYNSGLQIIDISTPSSSFVVGAYNTHENVTDVYVLNNYIYITLGSSEEALIIYENN